MPPQPLSSVKSGATVIGVGDTALMERPALATLVARTIGAWAYAESYMGHILIAMLGASAEPAAKMYAALQSSQVQLNALMAAARCSLPDQNFEMFQAIIELVRPAARARHRLAHDLWCYSDDLPDALLLLEESASFEFLVQRNVFRFDHTATAALVSGRTMPDFPIDRIFVYRERELLEIIKQIITVHHYLGLFVPIAKLDVSTAASNYDELLRAPQIQEALVRLRKQSGSGP